MGVTTFSGICNFYWWVYRYQSNKLTNGIARQFGRKNNWLITNKRRSLSLSRSLFKVTLLLEQLLSFELPTRDRCIHFSHINLMSQMSAFTFSPRGIDSANLLCTYEWDLVLCLYEIPLYFNLLSSGNHLMVRRASQCIDTGQSQWVDLDEHIRSRITQ